MVHLDLAAAYQTVGEPWRRFDVVAHGVFEHASQVYLDAMQQRAPMLQMPVGVWVGIKEGDELRRLTGGQRYKVIAPPRYINNGAEIEIDLQAITTE